ncbi:DUF2382 domain-containing protein [Globicatella sanguinis]
MTKFIYGSYSTFEEAELAVEDLIRRGVYQGDITIATNSDYVTERVSRSGVDVNTTEIIDEDNSWWDAFVDFFNPEPHVDNDHYGKYEEYKDLILNGDVIVLVEESYMAKEPGEGYSSGNIAEYDAESHMNDGLEGVSTIKLHEEQLNVRKERQNIGEVEISKHVVEDTETIEVPVQREELHITRRTNTDAVADDHAFEEEKYRVPLSEEKVVVDKDVVVTGEVDVDKTIETETEEVSDSIRKEVLDVDGDKEIITEDKTEY